MNFDAWQTVWICLALSLLVLFVDGVLAHRAGTNKTEQTRKQQRNRRMDQTVKRSTS